MVEAADLAFRQAYALCPYSPEALFRYANLLLGESRPDDALRIATTTLMFAPDDDQVAGLVRQLEKTRKSQKNSEPPQ
jgi:hypothetical protein